MANREEQFQTCMTKLKLKLNTDFKTTQEHLDTLKDQTLKLPSNVVSKKQQEKVFRRKVTTDNFNSTKSTVPLQIETNTSSSVYSHRVSQRTSCSNHSVIREMKEQNHSYRTKACNLEGAVKTTNTNSNSIITKTLILDDKRLTITSNNVHQTQVVPDKKFPKNTLKTDTNQVLYDISITEATTLASYFILLQQIIICMNYAIPILENFVINYNKTISLCYMHELPTFISVQAGKWSMGHHFHPPVNSVQQVN